MIESLLGSGWLELKLVLKALVLPPASVLLLAFFGLLLMKWRPRLGAAMAFGGLALMWLLCLPAVGRGLGTWLCTPPPALSQAAVNSLVNAPDTAILVLGGGRRGLAPEYGGPDLKRYSSERLRYGVYLARRTGLPLAYSGGLSPDAGAGATESATAALVLQREYGLQLRWLEDRSTNTQENARNALQMLRPDGIRRVVLVTTDLHMRRALGNFEKAQSELPAGTPLIEIIPAPTGMPPASPLVRSDWWPTPSGLDRSIYAIYEAIGRLAGY